MNTVFISTVAFADVNQQREYYKQAKQALEKNNIQRYHQLSQHIEQYPLYPYLQHDYVRKRFKQLQPNIISEFLSNHGDLPQIDALRHKWLRHLAKQKNWQQFINDYVSVNNAEMNCLYLQARHTLGKTENLFSDLKQQWLVGKSLPDVCDPIFDVLYGSGEFNDPLIWQRIVLAMDNKKIGLAKYLAKKITTDQYNKLFSVWQEIHKQPSSLPKYRFNDGAATRDILTYGLIRLTRANLDKAISLYQQYSSSYDFSSLQQSQIRQAIVTAALKQNHHKQDAILAKLSAEDINQQLVTTILASGLEKRNWKKLSQWLAVDPPEEEAIRNPWLYWRARALDEIGNNESARENYLQLADSRDYYGFLAADYLKQQYGFNHKPLEFNQKIHEELTNRPAIARTQELLYLNEYLAARREWQNLITNLDTQQLAHAALLAKKWQWNDRVIITLGKAKLYDDLNLRFPLGFEKSISWYSNQHKLDKAWLYALIRTESGFFESARSPAGALGLMQVMPATARATAKKLGWKKFSSHMLMEAENNIPIGSTYLKNMLKRFDGNLILATAAYNAGPNRVKQWLPQKGCMEADIWIEQIPFNETRSYVKRILYYSSIYDWRLKNKITPVSQRMNDVFTQSYAHKNLNCERGLVLHKKNHVFRNTSS